MTCISTEIRALACTQACGTALIAQISFSAYSIKVIIVALPGLLKSDSPCTDIMSPCIDVLGIYGKYQQLHSFH